MASSVDFAFEGFRIIRERPILIAWWGALLLLNLIICIFILAQAGVPLTEHMSLEKEAAEGIELIRQTGAVLLAALIGMVFYAVMTCAVYRAVLGGYSPRYGYLRLGMDEVRQVVLIFSLVLMVLVVMMLSIVPLMILNGLLSLIAQAVAKALVPTVSSLVALAATLLNVWLAVRLSMVGVQSFDEKRLNLLGSLVLTRGRFWTLLGGFAVVFGLVLFVGILFYVIYMAIAAWITGVEIVTIADVPAPDFSSLSALLSPVNAAYVAVNTIVSPLTTALGVGAVAAAYQTLKNTPNA
ncbi:hypothetical protein [Asticcacaulis excentricus]|uniref:DUF4013 domain-containing protein n=1 Tax=Asticcacaulis excentricus TaxID=78587 RepID=A0A3G9G4I8_9CAUL|nr:hypothetical protein [Asticcacaulis excentricus]BBF79973.1 hypothetical protein EM6_0550 [Asticcacaulis excentricus]